jgi:predicted Zn finger-like uncharacterized protein
MTMITRCPTCATTFRVTPAHLQAHGGKVRCGRCATVFDGFRDLATLPAAMPAEPATAPRAEPVAAAAPMPAPSPPAPEMPAPAAAPPVENAPVEAAPVEPLPAEVAAEPVIAESPARVAEAAPATAGPAAAAPAIVEPGPEATESAATKPDVPTAAENAAPRTATPDDRPADSPAEEPAAVTSPALAAAAFEFEKPAEPVRRPRRPWGALAVVALLALGGQALYFFRGELSAQYPALRPTLTALCAMAGCTVALPQRPEKINIEASDLQAPDPATLRNHAGIDVGYPALDIVLTNTKDHTVARRIVLPAEYLDRGKDPLAGIPANGEFTVRLNLETGDLGAAGFRLDILAAPQP